MSGPESIELRQRPPAQVLGEILPWRSDWDAVARALSQGGDLAWLDAAPGAPPTDGRVSRFALLGAHPVVRLIQELDGPAQLLPHASISNKPLRAADRVWDLWEQLRGELPWLMPQGVPLGCGWIGSVGFEAARQLEQLPDTSRDLFALPLVDVGLYAAVIVLDTAARAAVLLQVPEVGTALGMEHEVDAAVAQLRNAWRDAPSDAGSAVATDSAPQVVAEQTRGAFEARVQRALEYIAAGDVYQVNLAQRLRLRGMPDAVESYRRLRAGNPAPFGACLVRDGSAVVSASPELFLAVSDQTVRTRPIKGTRRRGDSDDADWAQRSALWHSAKDAAELAMIVDLHRNDLGRVCQAGTMRVVNPRMIETHPAVFHTVAEITGVLQSGRTALDALRLAFPAGSISGVPKIRALELIDELEPVGRGAYTGSVVRLGLDGDLTASVAIRTLQQRGDEAVLHVGGGIVADSSPADEYDETLAKAAGLLRALGASDPIQSPPDTAS